MPYFWAVFDGMAEADMPLRGWEASSRAVFLGERLLVKQDQAVLWEESQGRSLRPGLWLMQFLRILSL